MRHGKATSHSRYFRPCSFNAWLTRNHFGRRARRKLICLALLFNLLTWSTPEMVIRLLPVLASAAFDHAMTTPGRLSLLAASVFGTTLQQESVEDRLARVATVSVSPSLFVGYQEQMMVFSALATDLAGQAVHGIKFDWETSDPTIVQIDDTGRATFLNPGLASITCRTGVVLSVVPVLVRSGQRPLQTDAEWLADQQSLGTGTSGGTSASLLPDLLDRLMPTASAQSCGSGGDGGDVAYDALHNDPANLVGSPHERAVEPTRMGMVMPEGSNWEFAVPIINLPGRGIGAGLTLYYNSRVWSRRGSAITFNAVNGWPFAGFSLGFGRIITYEPSGGSVKYLLIDPDGTRHFLGTAPTTGTNTLETSDGTHIQYVGNATSGELRYPDGTKVSIVTLNNRLLPILIKDSNGNFIQIAYKTFFPWNQAIDYIRDTLGRNIQFNYDSCSRLASITAPGHGGPTQTIAQFDYQARSLSFTFNGLTVENATSGQTLQTMRHIFFPHTATGYLFDYSDYGMIFRASMRRQMTIDGNGVISDGVESAKTEFNYPTSGSTILTDAPAFTQRTESPGGTSGNSIYSYARSEDTVAQTKTFTITLPDDSTGQPLASQLILTRSTNGGSTASGRLVKSELKNGSTSFARSDFTYTTDGGGSPQVGTVTSFDDAGTPTRTDFSYNNKGAVTNVREYGHQISGQWQVRRRTQYFYKSDSDSNYFVANLWRLVTQVSVFDAKKNTNDGDDVEIAKTTYTFDNYAALGGMQDYFNSSSTPGHDNSFGTGQTLRGNITGLTEWVDLAVPTTITRLAKLDVFGNLVKAQVTCCNERSWTFVDSNWYAHPTQITNGNPTGVHLRTTVAYDFNTSLVNQQTDPNNLVTSYEYDAARRLKKTTFPTGATSEMTYNDGSLSMSSDLKYVESGVNRTVTASAVYDGWGRVTQRVGTNSIQVNTAYDRIGRIESRTNPFPQGGGTLDRTSFEYDPLSRLKKATLPDLNTVSNTFAGTSVTPKDQVGREVKREFDGLGRLVKVTEPDSTGALTQVTTYSYDLLDRLVEIDQGGQKRNYKYDALGRLLFERIPEQTATINDGTGVMWTMKHTYTTFHAVSTRQDARGVVTTYGYDTLNRLTSITYDTTNAPGVAATPNVTYTYDTNTTTSTTKGLLLSVSVGAFYQESYSYDSFNRVSSKQVSIDSNAYTTAYEYNTASQITKITYPSGRQVAYGHDSKGRVNSIGSHVTSISYNNEGLLSALTLGSGVTESFTYNNRF